MSRFGKRPIPVTEGVQVQFNNRELSMKGSKGELKMDVHKEVDFSLEEGIIQLEKILKYFGINLIPVTLPQYKNKNSCFHLMSVISMLDKDLAIV